MHKFTLVLWVILIGNSWAQENRGIAKICSDYEAVSEIIVPYQQTAWPGVSVTPSGPVPTITMFTIAARQPISDFCSFITQLNSLGFAEQAFATADFANKLTDDQHTEKIDFARQTYDLGTALNNFNKNGRDSSKDLSLHRRINNYLRSADKFINGDKANTFENRGERERKMSLLIQSSNRINILKEAGNCPAPKIDEEEKNMAYFNKEIVPLYPLIEEREEDVGYFLSQLQNFGTLMSATYEEHKIYQQELYRMFNQGVNYRRSNPKTKTVKTLRGNETGRLKITYFSYISIINNKLFADFEEKYRKLWQSYVIGQIRTKGLFDNPTARATQQFRDTGYECRRNRIEWQMRRSNPNLRYEEADSAKFSMEVDRRVDECRKGVVIDEKKVDNLLSFYVAQLKQAMLSLKTMKANLWSYESEFLGQSRSITETATESDLGQFTAEKINCEEKLNLSETMDTKNRLGQESLNLRAQAAEEVTKKTLIMEAEANQGNQEEEELKRKRMIQEEEDLRRTRYEEYFGEKPESNLSF